MKERMSTMGKPTGFMDYKRENRASRSPMERIKNFNEFHTPLSERRTAATGQHAVWTAVFRSVRQV